MDERREKNKIGKDNPVIANPKRGERFYFSYAERARTNASPVRRDNNRGMRKSAEGNALKLWFWDSRYPIHGIFHDEMQGNACYGVGDLARAFSCY